MSHTMSNYLIELSAIHLALMLGYWLMLSREHQYPTMRFYLLGSVVLALVVPLLKLPTLFRVEETAYVFPTSPAVAGAVVTAPLDPISFWSYDLLIWAYILVSTFFLLKFFYNLRQLVLLKKTSHCEKINNVLIHRVPGVDGSFSFFNWIFISENIDKSTQAYEVMVAHEKAHAILGHTYDIVFLQLFRACFWWLPTTWLINQEMKKIHEYQADDAVLKTYSVDQYASILISSTLTHHGLSLASSFHDSLILKRLTAMRQPSKKVSAWKLAMLTALCAMLVMGFACTEEKKDIANVEGTSDQAKSEIFRIVEKMPEFEGGIDAFKKYIMKEITYPLEARQKGVEGRVDVQFVIGKDGSLSDVKALSGIGAGCDSEAERVIKSVPSFIPASQQGKPVKIRMAVPIVFMLGEKNTGSPKGIISIEQVQPLNAKLKVDAHHDNGEWSGTVYDEEGDGLPGVSILVEGTTTGTITDSEGAFKLKADGSKDVVLSFVGYDFVRLAGK